MRRGLTNHNRGPLRRIDAAQNIMMRSNPNQGREKKFGPQIVFLKGVNVGGYRSFRPRLLATQLANYEVTSIGAAGTFVVFKPAREGTLRAEFLRRLPFDAEIMICSASQIINLTNDHPFDGEPSSPHIVRFVSVLPKRPSLLPQLPLSLPVNKDWLVKILEIRDRFVFGLYRRTMRTITLLNQVEKHLGQIATTRNWNTMKMIVELLKRHQASSTR